MCLLQQDQLEREEQHVAGARALRLKKYPHKETDDESDCESRAELKYVSWHVQRKRFMF